MNNQSSYNNSNAASDYKENDGGNDQQRISEFLAVQQRNISEQIPQLTFSNMKNIN
jgi:hypothetical protein